MKEKAVSGQGLHVIIREMREGDIEGVQAIDNKLTAQNRAFTYCWSPFGGELTASVVAEAEGKIVGFLLGQTTKSSYKDANIALAQNIGVDPEYFHNHIGTRLVQGFTERCQKRGIESIHAMVRSRDEMLISFLRATGFIDGEMIELVKLINVDDLD
ncbi:MAG: GNAT family N-acetyltransferase [Smithella sp.]